MEPVVHDREQQIFYVEHDGEHAYLFYQVLEDGTLGYVHTYTPNEIRGRGIATRIIRYALEHAKAEGKQIKPTCPFVANYLERHPEFGDVVARSLRD